MTPSAAALIGRLASAHRTVLAPVSIARGSGRHSSSCCSCSYLRSSKRVAYSGWVRGGTSYFGCIDPGTKCRGEGGTVTAASTTLMPRRHFSLKSPGVDPLELLRRESEGRDLCDSLGFRKPGAHWPFSLAVVPSSEKVHDDEEEEEAPSLRTVGFQRVSKFGAEFVLKSAAATTTTTSSSLSPSSNSFIGSRPVSILYAVGRYRPGESVQQWRADGYCVPLELGDVLDHVPRYTVTEMVASVRAREEAADRVAAGGGGGDAGDGASVSKSRTLMPNQSHFTEMVQKTRIDLENGNITKDELERCIQAWRFIPRRMERMSGGPDMIMWDRWEWIRSKGKGGGGGGDDTLLWNEAQHLLPY